MMDECCCTYGDDETVTMASMMNDQVTEKRLYYDPDKETVSLSGGGAPGGGGLPAERVSSLDRVSLDMSGFTLVDCPTRNSKETLDKKILVDIMSFAYERVLDKKVRGLRHEDNTRTKSNYQQQHKPQWEHPPITKACV